MNEKQHLRIQVHDNCKGVSLFGNNMLKQGDVAGPALTDTFPTLNYAKGEILKNPNSVTFQPSSIHIITAEGQRHPSPHCTS